MNTHSTDQAFPGTSDTRTAEEVEQHIREANALPPMKEWQVRRVLQSVGLTFIAPDLKLAEALNAARDEQWRAAISKHEADKVAQDSAMEFATWLLKNHPHSFINPENMAKFMQEFAEHPAPTTPAAQERAEPVVPAVGEHEALRIADAIDPFTRTQAPDHLTMGVAAKLLRELSATPPAPAQPAPESKPEQAEAPIMAWMYRVSPGPWELTFNEDDTQGAHKVIPLAATLPPASAAGGAAESVNETNAILAGRYFELLKVVEAYEKHGVTCQTYRHFIDTPCAECNSIAAGDSGAGERERMTVPERELIEGVLRCAAGTHDLIGTPALAKQAREALDTFKRAALATKPQAVAPVVAVDNIEAAAKTFAERMDYPWDHMPEKGREKMRGHAKAVIEAASNSGEAL